MHLVGVVELPFNNFEELDVRVKLLAPWYSCNDTSDWVRLAEATIVKENKNS